MSLTLNIQGIDIFFPFLVSIQAQCLALSNAEVEDRMEVQLYDLSTEEVEMKTDGYVIGSFATDIDE